MQAARGQSAFVSCLAMGLILSFSGCAVGGKSFAIDSNSRVPFFGLELKERKAKDKAPSYRSISQSDRAKTQFQPALQSNSASQTQFLKQKDARSSGLRVTALTDNHPAERVVKTVSASDVAASAPESQPLPMKEVATSREPSDRAGTILDFQ